jgi:two-component system alkaline phosphatase synthesis response regulator PhoP
MIKQRILVVDDDELIRLSLKVNLERAGFNTDIAESGKSALALLEEQTYDLLLTDYLMPGINGLVLMQQAKEFYPKMKVIIFSAFVDSGLQQKFLAFGADDFLHKPLNIHDVLKRIQNILTPYTTVPQ